MDGPLSRKSAVCRRDRGLHATFSSLQEIPSNHVGERRIVRFPDRWRTVSFHAASAPEQTLVLCLQIGREANCRCHVMTSRRRFSSHVQSFPPPPGPDVVSSYPLTLRLHPRVQYGQAGQNSFLVGSRSRSCGRANSG